VVTWSHPSTSTAPCCYDIYIDGNQSQVLRVNYPSNRTEHRNLGGGESHTYCVKGFWKDAKGTYPGPCSSTVTGRTTSPSGYFYKADGASGSWRAPSGVSQVRVIVDSGGNAGGSISCDNAGNARPGKGGYGGRNTTKNPATVSPGSSYSYGASGRPSGVAQPQTGGSYRYGGAGAASYFSSYRAYCQSNGQYSGCGGNNGTCNTGTCSGNQIYTYGGQGWNTGSQRGGNGGYSQLCSSCYSCKQRATDGNGSATGGGGMQYSTGANSGYYSGKGGYGYIYVGWGSYQRKATLMAKAGIPEDEIEIWFQNVLRKTLPKYGYDYDEVHKSKSFEIIFDDGIVDDQYPEFDEEANGRTYLPDDYDLDIFLESKDLIIEANNIGLDDKLSTEQELLEILKAQKENNDR
jgi:hypothetical protein